MLLPIPPEITFRPDTCDELVFREVFDEDVYRLRDNDIRVAPALDLGANVGAFTIAALMLGCPHVHAVEPYEPNVLQLHTNLLTLGLRDLVTIHRGAAVGDGGPLVLDLIVGDSGYPNITFQTTVRARPDQVVSKCNAIPLSYLLRQEDDWSILKCDVEGAEYEIFDCPDMELMNHVGALTMEFHGRGMGQHLWWVSDGSLGCMVETLSEWGSVTTLGAASRGGQIYARRY